MSNHFLVATHAQCFSRSITRSHLAQGGHIRDHAVVLLFHEKKKRKKNGKGKTRNEKDIHLVHTRLTHYKMTYIFFCSKCFGGSRHQIVFRFFLLLVLGRNERPPPPPPPALRPLPEQTRWVIAVAAGSFMMRLHIFSTRKASHDLRHANKSSPHTAPHPENRKRRRRVDSNACCNRTDAISLGAYIRRFRWWVEFYW